MTANAFKCPECGSNESREFVLVETEFCEGNPWSGILQRYQCAGCNFVVPAHLAERWDGLTYDQAVQQWKELYRCSAPNAPQD